MGKHAPSGDSQVLDRILQHDPGWVFTPSAFHDLGSRTATAIAISRHKRAGTIRQRVRGLYDYPKRDPQLGLLFPSTDAVVAALKGRDAIRLQPTGAYAANLLGLSTQVPMKLIFLTDGPARLVRLGQQLIQLRHTTPRNMAPAGRVSGLVILRWTPSVGYKRKRYFLIERREAGEVGWMACIPRGGGVRQAG